MPRRPSITPRKRLGRVKGKPWCVDLPASVMRHLGEANAERKPEYFETRAAADEYCQDIRARAASFDDASRQMTGEQRLELWRCHLLALAHGFTVTTAVEAMRAQVQAAERSIGIPALVKAILNDRRYAVRSADLPNGKSASYVQDLKNRLERFARDHEGVRASNLTTEGLEVWLDTLEVGPVSRNNFRRLLKLALNYAIRKKWLIDNVARSIEIAQESTTEVEALTVTECAGLLHHAGEAELPVIALGLFAGIRPFESQRMSWEDIHWQGQGGEIDAPNEEPGDVDVKAHKAKTAQRRLVTIRPVLAAWLEPYRAETGPIYPPGKNRWYRELRAVRTAAGLTRWPADALRHTFCSMDFAHFNDLNGLVARMGHTDSTLVFSRYRRVVKAAEAAKFWNLLPTAKP